MEATRSLQDFLNILIKGPYPLLILIFLCRQHSPLPLEIICTHTHITPHFPLEHSYNTPKPFPSSSRSSDPTTGASPVGHQHSASLSLS
ncbi:hypothetical protein HanPI659440_Chr08g0313261 [Helianthus annuus]|nr:hypothetical protein HanPI659440_Chr08g0313261 [Helianthus annuus]